MSRVAGILARVKGKVAEHIGSDNIEAYEEIRGLLGDCQELMAVHCDCAPIMLIAGRTDDIMANLEYSKKTVPLGT